MPILLISSSSSRQGRSIQLDAGQSCFILSLTFQRATYVSDGWRTWLCPWQRNGSRYICTNRIQVIVFFISFHYNTIISLPTTTIASLSSSMHSLSSSLICTPPQAVTHLRKLKLSTFPILNWQHPEAGDNGTGRCLQEIIECRASFLEMMRKMSWCLDDFWCFGALVLLLLL